MERTIRNSAKALIFKNGCMAAIKIDDHGDVFYIMPGGGQDSEELLTDAVARECAEELGINVAVKDLAFVIEGMYGESFHRVDLVFLCEYLSDIPHAHLHKDANQAGIDWLPIVGLENQPLYPSKLRKQIINLYHAKQTPVYLGNESMRS